MKIVRERLHQFDEVLSDLRKMTWRDVMLVFSAGILLIAYILAVWVESGSSVLKRHAKSLADSLLNLRKKEVRSEYIPREDEEEAD